MTSVARYNNRRSRIVSSKLALEVSKEVCSLLLSIRLPQTNVRINCSDEVCPGEGGMDGFMLKKNNIHEQTVSRSGNHK